MSVLVQGCHQLGLHRSNNCLGSSNITPCLHQVFLEARVPAHTLSYMNATLLGVGSPG